jgi:protein-disulfide isomerase
MRNRGPGLGLGLTALAVLMACGPSAEDVDQLKSRQQDILGKLGDLDKKLDTLAAARQAPARPTQPQEDPNKVYELPLGNSPVHGPAGAKVTIVEFSDFQ